MDKELRSLGSRAKKAMKRLNITTVKQLRVAREVDFLMCKGCGPSTVAEIRTLVNNAVLKTT